MSILKNLVIKNVRSSHMDFAPVTYIPRNPALRWFPYSPTTEPAYAPSFMMAVWRLEREPLGSSP